MTPADAGAVLAIYADGVATGIATLETEVPTWSAWDAGHLPDHRLVAVDDDGAASPDGPLLGWVAVSATSARAVYAGVVEVSVYVAASARGRGVGGALLDAVVESSERAGIWTLQSGVLAENSASLALHARHGFRRVGVRERIGARHGVWRDVVLLERRSARV
ncbi:N-acetyltransferase [Cellulomonas fimi]|uniref:N-acetyltransferase n=2 Tax=Cellulomonas fimi TaxID=1708 RepID=A0A7Y0LWX3_CELFI|nr:N-acetyltransferase [Cellulomonas fimi]